MAVFRSHLPSLLAASAHAAHTVSIRNLHHPHWPLLVPVVARDRSTWAWSSRDARWSHHQRSSERSTAVGRVSVGPLYFTQPRLVRIAPPTTRHTADAAASRT